MKREKNAPNKSARPNHMINDIIYGSFDAKLSPTVLKSVNNLTNLESLINLPIFRTLHLVLIN